MEHEKSIEHCLDDIGWHLVRIRDGKKYEAAGYATFEDYCRERWHRSRRWAYRLMAASEIVDALSDLGPIGHTDPPALAPSSEGQIRALAPLRDDPEALRAAWDGAVDLAGGEQPTADQVAEAARALRQPQPLEKRDLGGRPHPATFPQPVLAVLADVLEPHFLEVAASRPPHLLDPFAGTGRIHALAEAGWDTVGIELEAEWADMHPRTRQGNALELPFEDATFDAIATSPTYGNRFADSYDASDPYARRSYRFDLGRELHPDNSGAMQWGRAYRDFHERAWAEAVRVLTPGGWFVLNIKDHFRDGRYVDVAGWHNDVLTHRVGLRARAVRAVPVSGLGGLGTNSDRRAPAEQVMAYVK